jgi:hypothetical protein
MWASSGSSPNSILHHELDHLMALRKNADNWEAIEVSLFRSGVSVLWLLIAIWILPVVAAMPRFWYFQIVLLNNRDLSKNEGFFDGGGFFDSSRYNPTGQMVHRQMIRLWLKVVAWGVGWWLVIGIVGPHLS